ncbi:A/G-specific adenine glycosylase [Gehongia tenuis]|uniref:Adenine DNA glycosylase n=1 Tax=Gehongia tenuis TaxID=2763655 RepID=A0A926HPS4_9FIRM|nr:A/G-specific adenine glycosylase [Gehongia tenuis]MBC8531513.1 A/G-specific adenine glycosylase [Gehongia tenuis]
MNIEAFRGALLTWFDGNKRDMPWRRTKDPYGIWVSEVMLQQTRVDTVIPYYERFMTHYPTVEALAEAPEEAVLKDWEGLGYYRRARNLQRGARYVLENHSGRMPRDYEAIRKVPGIGDYTAGAILSIAYNLPVPAVDGNVVRVMARLTGTYWTAADKAPVRTALEPLMDRQRPGSFTESMMELGAVICTPKNPRCLACPVQRECQAFQLGIADELPVKVQKGEIPVEAYTVLVLTCEERIYLQKRSEGLLGGLWEYFVVPGFLEPRGAEELAEGWGCQVFSLEDWGKAHHVFTHKRWSMLGYRMRLDGRPDLPGEWLTLPEYGERAIPSAYQHYTEKLKKEISER